MKDKNDTYPGGKGGSGVYQKIINLIPPHETYIELFAGGGSVFLHKKPAKQNILIDLSQPALEKLRQKSIISNATFFNQSAFDFLQNFNFRGSTFLYCDPPYLIETRRRKRKIYDYEFSLYDHVAFLQFIIKIPCMIAISGYQSELYDNALTGWNKKSFNTTNRAGLIATEFVWFNYPEPLQLHDYSHLGDDYRERERLKRKTTRWISRLKSLPELEKKSLLSAIYEELQNDFPFV